MQDKDKVATSSGWSKEDVQEMFEFLREAQFGGMNEQEATTNIQRKLMLHNEPIKGEDVVSFVHRFTLPHRYWNEAFQDHMQRSRQAASTQTPALDVVVPSAEVQEEEQEEDVDNLTAAMQALSSADIEFPKRPTVMLNGAPLYQRSKTAATLAMRASHDRLREITQSRRREKKEAAPAKNTAVGASFRALPIQMDVDTGEMRTDKDRDLVVARLLIEPHAEKYLGYRAHLRPPSPFVVPRSVFQQLQQATSLRFPSTAQNPWGALNLRMPNIARVELVDPPTATPAQRQQQLRQVLSGVYGQTNVTGTPSEVGQIPGWVNATIAANGGAPIVQSRVRGRPSRVPGIDYDDTIPQAVYPSYTSRGGMSTRRKQAITQITGLPKDIVNNAIDEWTSGPSYVVSLYDRSFLNRLDASVLQAFKNKFPALFRDRWFSRAVDVIVVTWYTPADPDKPREMAAALSATYEGAPALFAPRDGAPGRNLHIVEIDWDKSRSSAELFETLQPQHWVQAMVMRIEELAQQNHVPNVRLYNMYNLTPPMHTLGYTRAGRDARSMARFDMWTKAIHGDDDDDDVVEIKRPDEDDDEVVEIPRPPPKKSRFNGQLVFGGDNDLGFLQPRTSSGAQTSTLRLVQSVARQKQTKKTTSRP